MEASIGWIPIYISLSYCDQSVNLLLLLAYAYQQRLEFIILLYRGSHGFFPQSPVHIATSYKNREQNLGGSNLHSICPMSGLRISWNCLRPLGNATLCSLSSASLPCTQWISIKSIWLVFLDSTPNWIFFQHSNNVLNSLSSYLTFTVGLGQYMLWQLLQHEIAVIRLPRNFDIASSPIVSEE